MQGVRTLFSQYIDPVTEVATASAKGRSSCLDAKRNKLLVTRYAYYLLYKKEPNYDSIIKRLHEEFFLSTRTITNILLENTSDIAHIKKEMPPVASFRRQYPHLVWL